MIIKLVVRDGAIVAEYRIPDFNTAPQVIIWGERVFQLDRKFDDLTYVECFAYYLT